MIPKFENYLNEASDYEFNPSEAARRLKDREKENIQRYRAAQDRGDNYAIELYELKGDKRITKNKLTKYEFVRIIGERTKQLSMGAKPLVNVNKESEELEYNELALEELI